MAGVADEGDAAVGPVLDNALLEVGRARRDLHGVAVLDLELVRDGVLGEAGGHVVNVAVRVGRARARLLGQPLVQEDPGPLDAAQVHDGAVAILRVVGLAAVWVREAAPEATILAGVGDFRVPVGFPTARDGHFSHDAANLAVHAVGADYNVAFVRSTVLAAYHGAVVVRCDVTDALSSENLRFRFCGKAIVDGVD